MLKRVLVAVIGIPLLLLVLIWAPQWVALVLVAALTAVGAYELMHAVAGESGKKLIPLTVFTAALVPVDSYCQSAAPRLLPATSLLHSEKLEELYGTLSGESLVAFTRSSFLPLLGLLFVLILFMYAILHYGRSGALPFSDLTFALFAGLIFPMMLTCLLQLFLVCGRAFVFIPLCIAFGSDTFALFAGMLCGRHKLAPHVSPKKTVEGAVGGLLGGVIGMTVFRLGAYAATGDVFPWSMVLLFGLLGSVVSQVGDLSFSVIKREFGIKDYGKLLPGHGGVLDRFDSVTFVTPFVWLTISMFF